MANAFDIAIGAMFRDPNVAMSATYRAGGTGSPVVVRVVRIDPEPVFTVGGAPIVNNGLMLEVMASVLPNVAEGDVFETDIGNFKVQAEPTGEADGLIWRLDVVKL